MKKIKKFKFNDKSDESNGQKEKQKRSTKNKLKFTKDQKYKNFKKFLEEE